MVIICTIVEGFFWILCSRQICFVSITFVAMLMMLVHLMSLIRANINYRKSMRLIDEKLMRN